ncbi:MAG: hypothetical protein SNJ83_14200, partial [Aggregatilineales bacterium]
WRCRSMNRNFMTFDPVRTSGSLFLGCRAPTIAWLSWMLKANRIERHPRGRRERAFANDLAARLPPKKRCKLPIASGRLKQYRESRDFDKTIQRIMYIEALSQSFTNLHSLFL